MIAVLSRYRCKKLQIVTGFERLLSCVENGKIGVRAHFWGKIVKLGGYDAETPGNNVKPQK
jgi:hypothetical protein